MDSENFETPNASGEAGRTFSRRQILKAGAGLASLGLGYSLFPQHLQEALAQPTTCGKLNDIDHIVIFIQENRSFDHYFGSYRGVRGFNDPGVKRQANGRSVFYQPDPTNTTNSPAGYLLPFHLDTQKTNAACTHDISHDWAPQHQSWNNGKMDGFVQAHRAANQQDGTLTMGYYTRADLPFYYAVADAFTICDNYHCSVMGPTDPNRLYTMSATLDPDGKNGGPLLQTLVANRPTFFGRFTWTTMPEQLQAKGISWKVYADPGTNLDTNVLPYFKNFQNPASPLFQNAFSHSFLGDFLTDAKSGNLPQVSWVLAPEVASEHPPAPSEFGENSLQILLSAVTSRPQSWAKTAVFATYDENGGFFDHVPPLVAPAGTPGEYVTAVPVPDATVLGTPPLRGPIGLGFRVPMLVLSPLSRGGFVCSDRFDHTSVLKFLEKRFGVEVPNLSAWRRRAVGDLTTAFNFAAPNASLPTLPNTLPPSPQVLAECVVSLAGTLPYAVPQPQQVPTQEPGKKAPAPSGLCGR